MSPMHLLIILVIGLIVLGPKRLPEAGRGLGEAMRGFKDAIADDSENRKPASLAAQRAAEPRVAPAATAPQPSEPETS